MEKDNDRDLRSTVEQDHTSFLTKQAPPSDNVDTLNCVAAVTVSNIPSSTNGLLQTSNVEIPDAEARGRIVVRNWDAIAQPGVFAVASISAGEVLGVLQGNIVRRRRLTRAERRRLIGIRVDGRAAHMDLQGRWPEMINHAPPSRCNADWDPDRREITATRDILPGQQVMWDYGPGFWVDELINKDYDKLCKDQKAFFDVAHAMIDNYTWLIHAFRGRKLSQGMRIGIIAFYLSQLRLGASSTARFLGIDEASNGATDAQQDTNPLVQYLLDQGIDNYPRSVDERSRIKPLDDSSSLRCPTSLDLPVPVMELAELHI
jgi:hypothetical protein